MQMKDLFKPLSEMSEAELLEHIRGIRHRRETLRPVAAKKAERVEKKVSRTRMTKAETSIANLSEEDRLKLIALLQGQAAG